jgi:hypothetical protein
MLLERIHELLDILPSLIQFNKMETVQKFGVAPYPSSVSLLLAHEDLQTRVLLKPGLRDSAKQCLFKTMSSMFMYIIAL